jgi:hypothetical protein
LSTCGCKPHLRFHVMKLYRAVSAIELDLIGPARYAAIEQLREVVVFVQEVEA